MTGTHHWVLILCSLQPFLCCLALHPTLLVSVIQTHSSAFCAGAALTCTLSGTTLGFHRCRQIAV